MKNIIFVLIFAVAISGCQTVADRKHVFEQQFADGDVTKLIHTEERIVGIG